MQNSMHSLAPSMSLVGPLNITEVEFYFLLFHIRNFFSHSSSFPCGARGFRKLLSKSSVDVKLVTVQSHNFLKNKVKFGLDPVNYSINGNTFLCPPKNLPADMGVGCPSMYAKINFLLLEALHDSGFFFKKYQFGLFTVLFCLFSFIFNLLKPSQGTISIFNPLLVPFLSLECRIQMWLVLAFRQHVQPVWPS